MQRDDGACLMYWVPSCVRVGVWSKGREGGKDGHVLTSEDSREGREAGACFWFLVLLVVSALSTPRDSLMGYEKDSVRWRE